MSEPPRFVAAAVRGIVFDLDGTLIDSFGAITESVNHARAAWGLPALAEAEVRPHVGRGLELLIADLVGADRVDRGVRDFRERYGRVYRSRTTALPGARTTLARLRDRGYRMAVASNKPARFSAPILEHLGLAPFVECVLGPDLAGSTKPEPTMIRLCLERMGVDRTEAVYVGDMALDVEAGARAGLSVLLVAENAGRAVALRETGQTVLDSLDALTRLLSSAAPAS